MPVENADRAAGDSIPHLVELNGLACPAAGESIVQNAVGAGLNHERNPPQRKAARTVFAAGIAKVLDQFRRALPRNLVFALAASAR